MSYTDPLQNYIREVSDSLSAFSEKSLSPDNLKQLASSVRELASTLDTIIKLAHSEPHLVHEILSTMTGTPTYRPEYSRPLRIFLCHSSNDKAAVRSLYYRLRTDNFDPWLDEENLLPGQDWDQEIAKSVRNSDIALVCLSRSCINKTGYVQKEIKYALDVADEQPDGSIFLIPVKLEECNIPDRLRRLQWVNIFKREGYQKLIRALEARAERLGIMSNTKEGEDESQLQSLIPALDLPKAEQTRWGPVDGRPAGISINNSSGRFIPWEELRNEIEQKLLTQVRFVPIGSIVRLGDFRDRKDWIVRVFNPDGKEIANIWFGPDPDNHWAYDGLVRIGEVYKTSTIVWQVFERYSDASYRRKWASDEK